MIDVVIAVNSGSSSLKFAAYPANNDTSQPLIRGKVSGIGRKPELAAFDEAGPIEPTGDLRDIPIDADHEWMIAQLLERLRGRYSEFNPIAVGHRVVHGGEDFVLPVIIDSLAREALERLVPLAPSHQPHNLAAIDAITKMAPGMTQVACFDTSFHRSQPRLAQLFGLPRRLSDAGVVRYGFHGLSYEFIADTLPDHLGSRADGRVIVAHLGNGASMCAMKSRKSMATSMGFTALDGLLMGRRCGSLDVGIVLDLLQNRGMSVAEVHHMLYRESGLLGVSGISNNMLDLEQSSHPHASEAIELFCYRAACELGALAATIGGLDALVFTAGIGEKSSRVRRMICERSAWLGIDLDNEANTAGATMISKPRSDVNVLVIPTDEEATIVRATKRLINAPRS